ncbi:tRNA-intron lyase [Fervidicoccus sp.]|uniref:tRNA-intron lyase n=1 Tax=Fervidicoccus sp. TaxID=2060324 RepID=UPI003D12AFF3
MTSDIYPSIKHDEKFIGHLVGLKVLIKDTKIASKIYMDGFYGKPFGIKKPERREYNEVLELSLVEALYLVEKGKLSVLNSEGKEMSFDELLNEAYNRIKSFKSLYIIYRDLREKGYVVRSGLKFGSDYSLYRHGPGIEHAPYLIHVYEGDEIIDPIELVRMGRLSHSVKKKFMLGIVRNGIPNYILFKWYKP